MNKIKNFNLKPIRGCSNDNIYSWVDTYEYDGCFLGIMAGLLNVDNFFNNEYGII